MQPLRKVTGWARPASILILAAMLLAAASGAAGATVASPKIRKDYTKRQDAKRASDNYKKWLAVKVRNKP